MSGEIEEPFRFNFQADLLHSGSISFGRFESESLSWERRSSFSHNRYLEEVEKYSKPGSVTEKKAYFEAHFRRKSLLKQSSSEYHDGREFQTSENDDPQDLQDSENGNESKYFTSFGKRPHSSGHSKYDEETDIQKCEKEKIETVWAENDNTGSHVTSFDESYSHLGYEGGEILECEGAELGVSSVAPKDESTINIVDHMVSGSEHLKIKETRQIGTKNVVLVESEENTGETLNDIVVMVDVASQNDSSLTSDTADKDEASANSGPQRKFSSKVRPASKMKQTESKQKVQANAAQVQRTISSEASIGSAKAKTRKSEGLLMKEKQKMSPRPASPITHSGRKTSKSEESSMNTPKARLVPPKKSIVKEYRSEKAAEAKSSVSEKSLPEARQTANRVKQTIGLSKPRINPGVNQGAAGFTFKSDQRAERRKEVISTSMRTPNRPRTPCMATRTNRFPSNSTASSADTRPTSSISLTNRNCPSESLRKSHVPERRIQEKKRESSSHKQKQPEATKGPRASRKDTKGVEIGPKMGYAALGVVT
ncbi:protein WVD2-like 7 isoform X2 [Cynara cardunculus var. scolymus]|uniref:protein WVD2-like 7 isoform X2 n=1 Tax=Cynara cardunculus var. scolymus TaxID=59895 RepID=UPI000D623606|nr:protein WVD2-like 7 isoform X2 [Cynara cardunculus var. scolymus]